MSVDRELLEDPAEDLFEDAPCAYLTTGLDGTILKVNRTLESWIGFPRDELLGRRRLQDLFTVGGRIYYETHVGPLLLMQGSVREIAVEVARADGSRLPALVNAVVRRDREDRPQVIRVTLFDATDRRRYEQELLRARRREQDIAQRLQRSLLSGALPAAPGLELEVAYRPGISGLEVGGDWYDAFWLQEDRTIGLVVGDVVGRGIDAAATMGQLRSALRALASTGLGPAALLVALDEYARRHEVGRMTTLVCAALDVVDGTLRYACAGHPPPVLLAPGRPPELLWDGRSMPLDAHAGRARPRAEGHRELAPGSAVLLYSDGLVERRSRSLDEGFDRLLDEVAARRDHAAAAMAGELVAGLQDPEHADDVCLLVARTSVQWATSTGGAPVASSSGS